MSLLSFWKPHTVGRSILPVDRGSLSTNHKLPLQNICFVTMLCEANLWLGAPINMNAENMNAEKTNEILFEVFFL